MLKRKEERPIAKNVSEEAVVENENRTVSIKIL